MADVKLSTIYMAAIGLGLAGVGAYALGYHETRRPDRPTDEACRLCHGYVNIGTTFLILGAGAGLYGALR